MIEGESSLTNPHKARPSFQTQKQAHGWQATEQPITRANQTETNQQRHQKKIKEATPRSGPSTPKMRN